MVITTNGLDIAKQIIFDHFDTFGYIAVGTGSTTPVETDTVLSNEVFRELIYDTTKNLSTGVYVFTIYLTTVEGNYAINEIGIFDASTSGNMGLRNLTTNYTKIIDEEARIQVAVEVGVSN